MSNKQHTIIISIAEQSLYFFQDEKLFKTYAIASAKNGIGQIEGSECTPLGKHRIAEKIGEHAPENAVFIGRQWHQEIYTEELAKREPNRDWILTRILWLDGLEPKVNKGFVDKVPELYTKAQNSRGQAVPTDTLSCDTKSRYIYIHGCPDSHAMQIPSSHGCIKMRNADMIELFEAVDIDTTVSIQAEPVALST